MWSVDKSLGNIRIGQLPQHWLRTETRPLGNATTSITSIGVDRTDSKMRPGSPGPSLDQPQCRRVVIDEQAGAALIQTTQGERAAQHYRARVALISGTYILTDTIDHAYAEVFRHLQPDRVAGDQRAGNARSRVWLPDLCTERGDAAPCARCPVSRRPRARSRPARPCCAPIPQISPCSPGVQRDCA